MSKSVPDGTAMVPPEEVGKRGWKDRSIIELCALENERANGKSEEYTKEYLLRAAAHRGLKGPDGEQRPSWWAITKIEVMLRTLEADNKNRRLDKDEISNCLGGRKIKLKHNRSFVAVLMEEARDYWHENSYGHPELGEDYEQRPFRWDKGYSIPDVVIERMQARAESRYGSKGSEPDAEKLHKLRKQIDWLRGRDFSSAIFENSEEIAFDHMGSEAHKETYGRSDRNIDDLRLAHSYRWESLRDAYKKIARDVAEELFDSNKNMPWREIRRQVYYTMKPMLRILLNGNTVEADNFITACEPYLNKNGILRFVENYAVRGRADDGEIISQHIGVTTREDNRKDGAPDRIKEKRRKLNQKYPGHHEKTWTEPRGFERG